MVFWLLFSNKSIQNILILSAIVAPFASTGIRPVVNRLNQDTTVYYGLVFCLFSWPYMVKWHDSGRIKSCISSFIPCLFCRWKHYLWCRYWFPRPSRWSRHAFRPRFSLVSLFPSRSGRTRHSCFSGFSRWSHRALRAFLSLRSPPATWSLRASGTRESGEACRTDLFTCLTVCEWHKLFKLLCDFFSHVLYCGANWSVV